MIARTETYLLKNGTGRIAIHGDAAACGLFIYGKPFLFHWPDCAGSIGKDMYRFGSNIREDQRPSLAEVVARVPDAQRSLSDPILPLLSQFPSGTYTLTLLKAVPDEWEDEYSVNKAGDRGDDEMFPNSSYYPDDGNTLLTTQPYNWLDWNRIDHFLQSIEAGERPFAITLTLQDAECEFILDGHHKLMAYTYAQQPAWRLRIAAHHAEPLRFEDWPTGGSPLPSWYAWHDWKARNKR